MQCVALNPKHCEGRKEDFAGVETGRRSDRQRGPDSSHPSCMRLFCSETQTLPFAAYFRLANVSSNAYGSRRKLALLLVLGIQPQYTLKSKMSR